MIRWLFILYFLDAPSHLHKRVCSSVCPSVRPSVDPSVRMSVRPSRVIFRRVLGASCAVYPALFLFCLTVPHGWAREYLGHSSRRGVYVIPIRPQRQYPPLRTMVQNTLILRLLIIHFPMSLGVSEWSQQSLQAKPVVWSKQMNEWCERMSEWTSTCVLIHGSSEPQCCGPSADERVVCQICFIVLPEILNTGKGILRRMSFTIDKFPSSTVGFLEITISAKKTVCPEWRYSTPTKWKSRAIQKWHLKVKWLMT